MAAVHSPGADPPTGPLWPRSAPGVPEERHGVRGNLRKDEERCQVASAMTPSAAVPPATPRPRPWGRSWAPGRPRFEAPGPPPAAAAPEKHWARGCLPASRSTAHLGSRPLPPAAMAFAAQESAGPERRRPPRHPALRELLLLCLWLSSGRAAGPPPAPLSELHAQLSSVEQLLEDFRRQLQQERPQEELELRAGRGPQQSCPSPGSGSYSVMSDAIIRIKDSIAAGASFLRAPAAVRDWRQCVAACCSEPRCSVAVVELPRRPVPLAPALGCYLFNCTASGRSVCRFSLRPGYSSYSLSRALEGQQDLEAGVTARASPRLGKDAPPLSKAGQDVVLRLPTDEVTLDGRESTDDHAIVRYEWALLQGDPSVDMKVPESGTLKLSHLQEGTYTFQLTVTDDAAQRSSDNISVTVLPAASSPGGCLKVCSRYHFFCDNGCCIDITLACDGVQQCPDGSDEAFCHSLSLERKAMTHMATAQPRSTGRSEDAAGGFSSEKFQKDSAPNGPPTLSDMEKRNRSTFSGSKIQTDPVVPDSGSSGKSRKEENYIFESKSNRGGAEHPAPEIGAVLPLTLGLAITVLLLLMVACRLRLVKQKLKKARPITSEESDYLINGMYL